MNGAVQEMIDLLQMEQIEENLFRAQNGPGNHVFGGQVLGQAIVAASKTVEDRHLHSIHAYFLRRGDPKRPILFDVDRIRDGSSFTTRRVVGIQHGQAIFNMSSSFQVEESGLQHQSEMPKVPPPDELPSDGDIYRKMAKDDPSYRRFAHRFEVIDSRQVEGIQMLPARRSARDRAPQEHLAPLPRSAARRPHHPPLLLRLHVRPGLHGRFHATPRPIDEGLPDSGREPRPRPLAPPALPRRRVAPVQQGEPGRGARPRFRPRPRLQPAGASSSPRRAKSA